MLARTERNKKKAQNPAGKVLISAQILKQMSKKQGCETVITLNQAFCRK